MKQQQDYLDNLVSHDDNETVKETVICIIVLRKTQAND